MRQFETGATRDSDEGKIDYEGFLSPLAIRRFGQYMHKHRMQADGKLRDSDNWQKGIPIPQYMKSLLRHVFDLWRIHRGWRGKNWTAEELEDLLCAIMFNVQGYLHEWLRGTLESAPPTTAPARRELTPEERQMLDTQFARLRAQTEAQILAHPPNRAVMQLQEEPR